MKRSLTMRRRPLILLFSVIIWTSYLAFPQITKANTLDLKTTTSKIVATQVAATAVYYGTSNYLISFNYWNNDTGGRYKTVASSSSYNETAAVLQATLNTIGYNLTLDGYFGSSTLAAVKSLQLKTYYLTNSLQALSADGIVGPYTWGKILILRPTIHD